MSPYTNQAVERNSVVGAAGSAESNIARWARRISREKLISFDHAYALLMANDAVKDRTNG
jgi:hypothetical protein